MMSVYQRALRPNVRQRKVASGARVSCEDRLAIGGMIVRWVFVILSEAKDLASRFSGGPRVRDSRSFASLRMTGDRSLGSLSRNHELETIRIVQPKGAPPKTRIRLGVQRAAALLDARGDLVDVLGRDDHHREALTFDAIRALGAIVLRQQNRDRACLERHRHLASLALVFALDVKADDVAIPGEAFLQIVHSQ